MTKKKINSTIAMFLTNEARKDLIKYNEVNDQDEDSEQVKQHLMVRGMIIKELLLTIKY
tara:strand:- start:1994 stop:2170 length:177 start_codon:yes stop_codon:yes gene_type:complete